MSSLAVKDNQGYKNNVQEYAELREKKKVLKARRDRNAFCEYVFKDEKDHLPIKQAPIHRAIQFAFENYQKVFIEISRHHGKTIQSLASLLIEIGRNTDIRIKILGASDDKALGRVNALRTHIEFNKQYNKVYPHVFPFRRGNTIDTWGKKSFTVDRKIIDSNPTVKAMGILSTGVGDRADLILFDDPCDFRNTIINPSNRERIIEAYESVWVPLLSDEGRQWYLATPWHKNDLTAVIKERWADQENACVIELHVGQKLSIVTEGNLVLDIEETDDKFLPIWKEKWGREALMRRCEDIKSRAYDLGYRCMAISSDELIFKTEWLENAKDARLTLMDSFEPYLMLKENE